MQLYVVRHQESEDNLHQIIQGPGHDSSLTQKGREDAIKLADMLLNEFGGRYADKIVASPARRAAQTAHIFADRLGIPVVYDSSLVESDPGILVGQKGQAEKKHPQELKVWYERGDLDHIPGAETGDKLQARAIYFLERYMSAPGCSLDVVVSHAGTIRSIVNTARGCSRTKPLEHQHDRVHIVNNPWRTMHAERLSLAKSSEAYMIRTQEQNYVMKIISDVSEDELSFQYEISGHVAKDEELLSEVLFWGQRSDHAVQVLKYLQGDHITRELTDRQRISLLTATHKLAKKLKAAPPGIKTSFNPSLRDKLELCLSSIEDSPIRSMGKQLLSNPIYRYLSAEASQVLVHYDLNKCNVLFDSDDRVRFLDLGGLTYSPEQFMPASLFMSFFLLEEGNDFSLDSLLRGWPCQLNREHIIILMQARAIIGGSFFQKRISGNNHSSEDVELFQKYLNSTKFIETMLKDGQK